MNSGDYEGRIDTLVKSLTTVQDYAHQREVELRQRIAELEAEHERLVTSYKSLLTDRDQLNVEREIKVAQWNDYWQREKSELEQERDRLRAELDQQRRIHEQDTAMQEKLRANLQASMDEARGLLRSWQAQADNRPHYLNGEMYARTGAFLSRTAKEPNA